MLFSMRVKFSAGLSLSLCSPSRWYMVQNPRGVLGNLAIDCGRPGPAAVLRAEGYNADEMILRWTVLCQQFHQRSATVSTTGILTEDTAHAHLLVPDVRITLECPFASVRLDDRQFDRLQDDTGLRIVCNNQTTCCNPNSNSMMKEDERVEVAETYPR